MGLLRLLPVATIVLHHGPALVHQLLLKHTHITQSASWPRTMLRKQLVPILLLKYLILKKTHVLSFIITVQSERILNHNLKCVQSEDKYQKLQMTQM